MRGLLCNVTIKLAVCRRMLRTHGQKLGLELHEQTLGLLWWWVFKRTQKHIIMVAPEIDILKIESTITQRRFQCFEAFFFLFFHLFLDYHHFLTLSSQPQSQPTTVCNGNSQAVCFLQHLELYDQGFALRFYLFYVLSLSRAQSVPLYFP